MQDKPDFKAMLVGYWDTVENAIELLESKRHQDHDLADFGDVIGKALTLYQPYAYFMFTGEKQFETRSWGTNYRGTVFIHAGKRLPLPGSEEHIYMQQLLRGSRISDLYLEQLERGAIIGCGSLVDCIKMDADFCKQMEGTREYEVGFYEPGRYAWKFEDLTLLHEPFQIKGQLGLWDVRL